MELISPFPSQPVRRPVLLQRWQNLTFLHWPYRPEVIQRLLPQQLKVDTFDGSAWVGLVPFVLSGLRVPFTPAAPWISHFPETNVRTYVKGPDGGRGVWFFTLEADRLLAVLAARVFYRLPYRWAAMQVRQRDQYVTEYRSRRRPPFGQAHTDIAVAQGERLVSGPLEHFLTAQFRLYTRLGQRIAFANIEHQPWSLYSGRVLQLEQDLVERCGLLAPKGEPILHFSPDLTVRVGRLQLLNRQQVRLGS